jgi:ribonuclease III
VSGRDHEREFTQEVLVGQQSYGVGSGPSKQAAAQQAARAALERLREE